MISYLSGLIIDKDEKTLTVLVSGVGYQVFATTDLIVGTPLDQKVHLFIHTAVKEDDISLYGFKEKEARQFYQTLLTVSGIGPRMGMEILACPIDLTKNAILSEDIGTLTKIKGLGKKTAERLCLELKNKIEMPMNQVGQKNNQAKNEEAVLALESLGYERYQILKSISQFPTDLKDTESIVKYFLKSGV